MHRRHAATSTRRASGRDGAVRRHMAAEAAVDVQVGSASGAPDHVLQRQRPGAQQPRERKLARVFDDDLACVLIACGVDAMGSKKVLTSKEVWS